jgi:hypothetical protein
MVLVRGETIEGVEKGGNMAVPLLAQELSGGVFLGFIGAVSFATFLAVVAGLALAGAAALSHDLWVNAVRKGEVPEREQIRVARIATVLMGAMAIALGIALEGQNVAFMVGLAVAIAASANFPGAAHVDLLAPVHDMGRGGEHRGRHGLGRRGDRRGRPGRDPVARFRLRTLPVLQLGPGDALRGAKSTPATAWTAGPPSTSPPMRATS